MKRIRLLTISTTCEKGGSDINLLRLLKGLNKNEYEILHLIPYPGPLEEEFRNAGVKVEILDMPRIRLYKNPLRYITIFLKFIPTVFKIKNKIIDFKADIICSSSMLDFYGPLAARLTYKPHILIAGEYLFALRPFGLYFQLFSDKIICCSSLVSRMFKKSKKVLIRYHGIDLDEFSPNTDTRALREKLGSSAGLVSMVTRLASWKGIEVFIRAASYIKGDIKFIIFGEPILGKENYRIKLEKLIERLGLKDKISIITGEYRNIPRMISASDIIVHASLRPEPFGLIIIEAMAAGKPIIASKIGGPLEIINDGVDGILVEPGDPGILAQAISNLLNDHGLAKALSLRAREKASNEFDLREYVKSFDNISKDTLKEYSLECARICIGKDRLSNISRPLAKLLVWRAPESGNINKDTVKKILVIQLFGMGDLVCSMPLLDALRRSFNKARITLLINSKLIGFADILESGNEIIGYKRGILSKFRLIFDIRRDKYDMAVVLNPLLQGAWIAYLAKAKYRLGYVRDYDRIQNIEKLKRLLTHPILPLDKPMHDIRRYLGIVEFMGIAAEEPFSQLKIPQQAIIWADKFLRDEGIKEGDFILGINPNAGWESRCWDAKRFAEVADIMIERHNAKVIFLGACVSSDMRRINMINASMKHKAISAAGKTDIPKLAALLKRCGTFLTAETGPMHLAAALGVDMVVLFGPGDIKKFGYEKENIVNVTVDGLFCRTCALNYQYKYNCADNVCMQDIKVEEVVKAIEALKEQKK